MSAFLSSNDTLNALVTYWDHISSPEHFTTPTDQLVRAYVFASSSTGNPYGDFSAAYEAGKVIQEYGGADHAVFSILLKENVLSLQHRYPTYPDMWEAADEYTYTPSPSVERWCNKKPYGHGNLVGLVRGYSYQSCEHDGWKSSVAYQIIDQIRTGLLKDLEKRDCKGENLWASFNELYQSASDSL
jgi:hypothetical protein